MKQGLDLDAPNKRKRVQFRDEASSCHKVNQVIQPADQISWGSALGSNTTRLNAVNNVEELSDEGTTTPVEEIQRKNLNVGEGVSDDVEIFTLSFQVKYQQCIPMWISFGGMKTDCPNATTIYIVSKKTGGQKT